MRYLPAFCLCVIASLSIAQTRESGPWWPHPVWGPTDQTGASNWITPDKIVAAASLIKTGQVYELGHPYTNGMPTVGSRNYKLVIAGFPTMGPFESRNRSVYFNDEYVAGEIGQVGTQFDGLGHPGVGVTMDDGSEHVVFYNGHTDDEIHNPYGLSKLGVENVKPFFTRGILIDIAALLDEDIVSGDHIVSLTEVRNALANQGIDEASIAPGDALLFNFGWWQRWPEPSILSDAQPYLGDDVVAWIIERQPSMVGSDITLDGPEFAVHTELIVKHGINNLEWMTFKDLAEDQVYEFAFILTPLRLKGATGSPVRPIAIK